MSTALPEQNQLWPEPLQDEPVTDTFPFKSLLKWLIPGAVGLIILALILGFLRHQASREIVYLSADNGLLMAVPANQASQRSLGNETSGLFMTEAADLLPILGIPQWSPNGRYLAATLSGGKQVAIYPSDLMAPTTIRAPEDMSLEWMAAASDGWSAQSRYLALIGADETRSYLLVFDVETEQFLPNPQRIDTRAGLSWSREREELLFTGYATDAETPGLQIMDAGGNITPFTPNDEQTIHADGAWSPNGQQIAYVASNNYTDSQDILLGDLWLVDASGANPVQLTSDNHVVAPVWSPLGDYLFYTRFVTETGHFELYRIATDTYALEQYIGPGTEAFIRYPFDRNLFLQWSPDGQQFLFVGDESLRPIYYTAPNQDTLFQIRNAVPVLGAGRWSPDGSQFAGTILENGTIHVALFKSPTDAPILSPESPALFAFPVDGWSPDSAYLALVRHEGTQNQLSLFNTTQPNLTTANFSLDIRAGLSWHPNGSQLLITALDKGITPTLQLYTTADHTTHPFAPNDNQVLRADGVWSPGGNQIAYIARDTLTDTADLPPEVALAGSLWIADGDGRNPKQLVPEGYNLAPIWDTPNSRLLFTRYLTETATYDLYQVDLAGEKSERIGPSTPAFAQFPMDRSLFYRWSPDGRRWLLLGATPENIPIFYQITPESPNAQAITEHCETGVPFAVRWSPTSRALLVTCSSGEMFLQWLDSNRVKMLFPNGLFPSWQP